MARGSSRCKVSVKSKTSEGNSSSTQNITRQGTISRQNLNLSNIKVEVEDEDIGINTERIQMFDMYEVMVDAVKQEVTVELGTDNYEDRTQIMEYPSTSHTKTPDHEGEADHTSVRRSERNRQHTTNYGCLQPFTTCHRDKSFKCGLCGEKVPQKKSLKIHLLTKHSSLNGENKLFLCNVCHLGFDSEQTIIEHLMLHIQPKLFQCKVCDKTLESKKKLKSHVNTHKGHALFTCSICGKTVKGHARSHMRIHWNEKRFKCQHCNMRFIQSSQLKVHERTHTGARPYACKVCSFAFSHSSALRVHMRIHTGEKPVKCMLCPAAFTQLPHLKKHMRCIHKTNNPYVCVPCMQFYHTKAELKEHITTNGCPEVSPPKEKKSAICNEDYNDSCEEEEKVDEPEIFESELARNLVAVKHETESEDFSDED